MRLFIIQRQPYPPDMDIFFGPPDRGLFGWGAWRYQTKVGNIAGYGELEYINFSEFVTEPKGQNPVSFDFKLHDGLQEPDVIEEMIVNSHAKEIILNAISINPATGSGFPWSVAPPG